MDTFTVTTTVTFHPYRVPPRCRKPRQVEETFTVATDIPTITSAEAPVACTFNPGYQRLTVPETDEVTLRSYDGAFYTSVVTSAGDEDFPAERTLDSWESDQVAAEREAHERLWKYLVIDGKVWETMGEPYYSVNTYGMGHNHGGTGLSLNFLRKGQDLSAGDYAATELESAIRRGRGAQVSVDFSAGFHNTTWTEPASRHTFRRLGRRFRVADSVGRWKAPWTITSREVSCHTRLGEGSAVIAPI